MNYRQAIEKGFTDYGKPTYAMGYISRKIDVDAQPVLIAGGNRRGQLYIELPCYHSTVYHYRQYLIHKNDLTAPKYPQYNINEMEA